MPPPSRCLHTLPLRTLDNALPTRSPRHHPIISLPSRSIQHRHASSAVGPAKGAKTLRLKKKGRPEKTARPPEPGERKALRKRIVLSNTNALTVRDVQPLSMAMEEMQAAEVQAIPAACIDQLRAVEAFKPKQGWSLFQTPAVLVRRQVQDLGVEMDVIRGEVEVLDGKEVSKKTSRKVVVGEKGAGKSVYLLQAMTMAFQRGWVVINLPEGTYSLSTSHVHASTILTRFENSTRTLQLPHSLRAHPHDLASNTLLPTNLHSLPPQSHPHSQQIHPRQTHPLGKTQTPLPHQGQRHSLRSAHPRPKRPRPRMAHLPGLLARNHTCKFRNRCQESG